MKLLVDESHFVSNDVYAERLGALQTCMQKLHPSQRQLVMTFYSADFSAKEIANRTNSTANRVYKVLQRIRMRLSKCVEQKMKVAHDF